MHPNQLKETTMSIETRKLIKIEISNNNFTRDIVNSLMGKNPESRFNYIKKNALNIISEIDV